jgi:ribonuclease HII
VATAVRRAAAAAPPDPFAYERVWWERGCARLAGVDEAGRGPLAGPVVAAAVILPPECWVEGADDSKKLDAGAREELLPRILSAAVCVGVGAASCREIERINILRASALAMCRAVARLPGGADHLLVDGLPVRELGAERHTAVVDGDARVHAIACASIVAKVTRDRLMVRLAARYPRYAWERNKGYATPEHLAALSEAGPTPHHRRTFAPVQLTLFPR